MGKRVAVLTPEGQFGTVDEADVDKMPDGSRVLSQKEVAQREVAEAYAKKSTASKVLGAVNTAVGAIASPLMIGQDPNAPPTLAEYGAGVRQGATAGLADAGLRKLADAVGGKAAGEKFAQQREREQTASPTAHAVGELAGMVGGSMLGGAEAGAARALPTAGISALGDVAEQAVGRGVAGLAERGVLGRAGATALEMGARGAVEGGLYGATQSLGEALTKDPELTADKVYAALGSGLLGAGLGAAGGAVMGGTGSLVKSGAKAAIQGFGEAGLGPAIASKAQKMSNELAVDALGATKLQMRSALENGLTKEVVGDYVNRIHIKPADEAGGLIGGSLKAGWEGRADNILESIQADKAGRIAEGISGAVKAVTARVNLEELSAKGGQIYADMLKDPTKVAGAESFYNRALQEAAAIGRTPGRVAADGTIDAADAFYLRSALQKQAYEVRKVSGAAGDAYKQWLREWDKASIQALDQAAEQSGRTGLGDEIRYWKREWQLASAAEEMAEGGAERIHGNNIIGLRAGVGLAVGAATGHPLGAAIAGIGGKLVHERGAAAGAYALGKVADLASLSKLVTTTDNQITAASRGLLTAAPKVKLEQPQGTPRVRAQQAMKVLASLQADPEATSNHIARQTEGIQTAAPEVAAALTQRHAAALAFLASKVPVAANPDPIDPHPVPRMSDADAASFARYAWYTEKPARFFTELAAGKITPEGAETAQALMPRAFAELQERTLDAIATHMARGRSIPFQQRLRIGTMLDIPAVPAQDTVHAQQLQTNVLGSDKQSAGPAPAKARASSATTQRSALDMLEAHGPGRR